MPNLLPGDEPFCPIQMHSLSDIAPLCVDEAYCTSFHVSILFGSSALTEQGITLIFAGDTRDSTVGPMCMPSVWKCNQSLVVHWSTHPPSLESFEPFRPGADLEIFDRGGPIEYPIGIYQNSGHTKIVAN